MRLTLGIITKEQLKKIRTMEELDRSVLVSKNIEQQLKNLAIINQQRNELVDNLTVDYTEEGQAKILRLEIEKELDKIR